MLLEGGDTDTNAAIVGGLFGALVGYNALPKSWKEKVLSFDCLHQDLDRPITYNPREKYLIPKYNLARLLLQVYNNSPEYLIV